MEIHFLGISCSTYFYILVMSTNRHEYNWNLQHFKFFSISDSRRTWICLMYSFGRTMRNVLFLWRSVQTKVWVFRWLIKSSRCPDWGTTWYRDMKICYKHITLRWWIIINLLWFINIRSVSFLSCVDFMECLESLCFVNLLSPKVHFFTPKTIHV